MEAAYSNKETLVSTEEIKQENKYLERSAYLGAGRLGLLIVGIALAGIGERFWGPAKETDYGKSFSDYKHES